MDRLCCAISLFCVKFCFSGKVLSVIEIFVETEMCGDIDWSASE